MLAVNVIEDVTEETEAALRERFLTEAGKALASSLDYEETLQRVARLAVPRMADWCAVELPDERGVLQQVALAHVDPEKVEAGAARCASAGRPTPTRRPARHAVLRSGRAAARRRGHGRDAGGGRAATRSTWRASGSSDSARHGRPDGHRRADARRPELRLRRRSGATPRTTSRSPRSWPRRAATAVENARLYTERSTAARTLQASLLPDQLPPLPGWRAAADYRAGQAGADVGGDFYDVFPVADGAVVILGDVTGKGVAAAALTSLVRHTARTGADFDPRPSAVLALVNTALRRAAAHRAGHDAVRPAARRRAHARRRRPSAAAAQARRAAPARKVGEPGLLLGRRRRLRRRARRRDPAGARATRCCSTPTA